MIHQRGQRGLKASDYGMGTGCTGPVQELHVENNRELKS